MAPTNLAPRCARATTDRLFSGATLDTGGAGTCNDVVTQTSGPSLCVIRARDITIADGAVLTVTGTRALVLVATRDLTVAAPSTAARSADLGPRRRRHQRRRRGHRQ
jgi:hypothetical protein